MKNKPKRKNTGAGKRGRSPRFPFIPLEKAIKRLQKINDALGKSEQPFNREQVMKALGYSGPSGAAMKTGAAMFAYDLLERVDSEKGGVKISEVGRKLLETKDETVRLSLLRRAALSPLMFRNVWRNARHCTREELEELLLVRGFTKGGAKRASRIYFRNSQLAELSELEVEPVLPERVSPAQAKKARRWEKKVQQRAAARQERRRARNLKGRRGNEMATDTLDLPLSAGRASIPIGISEEEFQLLLTTLRTWKAQLVKS